MYRVSYTYIGPTLDAEHFYGQRRAILFSTAYAWTSYHIWCRLPQATTVMLEQWTGTQWMTVAAQNEKVRSA